MFYFIQVKLDKNQIVKLNTNFITQSRTKSGTTSHIKRFINSQKICKAKSQGIFL